MARQILNQRDFEHYHQSIGQELELTHLRLRYLLGDRHWGEEGSHRETVVRKVLRQHMPEDFIIGTGFVRYQDDLSSQIDILIVKRSHPTLYKDGDVLIVTPDAVAAIIEVKCKRSRTEILADLLKLSDEASNIRRSGNWECWAGYFVLEENDSPTQYDALLEAFRTAGNNRPCRILNCAAIGPSQFARFWPVDEQPPDRPIPGPCWHAYNLPDHLAPSYFIGNCIDSCSRQITSSNQMAWFPINRPTGKEAHRKAELSLYTDEARDRLIEAVRERLNSASVITGSSNSVVLGSIEQDGPVQTVSKYHTVV